MPSLQLFHVSGTNLNLSGHAEVVHPGSHVDGVTPDVVERLLSTHNSGNHASDVNTCVIKNLMFKLSPDYSSTCAYGSSINNVTEGGWVSMIL